MFENIKNNVQNKFYPVDMDECNDVEVQLGIRFPNMFKEFYKEVGYGFLSSQVDNINRVMDPKSILDFRLRQNDYEFYPDIEIYEEFEDDKLIFFEGNESSMISIGTGEENEGIVYYYDVEISKNLKEFLDKISQNDSFYYDSF